MYVCMCVCFVCTCVFSYGTSKASVQQVSLKRQICLLEIDVQGAQAIKNSDIKAHYMFISCSGKIDTLKERLEGRGTEQEDVIQKRLKSAEIEFDFYDKNQSFFNHCIVNDNMEKSIEEICNVFQQWYPWITENVGAKHEK